MCARVKTLSVDQVDEILRSYTDTESVESSPPAYLLANIDEEHAEERDMVTARTPLNATPASPACSVPSQPVTSITGDSPSLRRTASMNALNAAQDADVDHARLTETPAPVQQPQRVHSIWLRRPESEHVEVETVTAGDDETGDRVDKRVSGDSDSSQVLERVLRRLRAESLLPVAQRVTSASPHYIPPWPTEERLETHMPVTSPTSMFSGGYNAANEGDVRANSAWTITQSPRQSSPSVISQTSPSESQPSLSSSSAGSDGDGSMDDIEASVDWEEIRRIGASTTQIEQALCRLYDDDTSSRTSSTRIREVGSDEARHFLGSVDVSTPPDSATFSHPSTARAQTIRDDGDGEADATHSFVDTDDEAANSSDSEESQDESSEDGASTVRRSTVDSVMVSRATPTRAVPSPRRISRTLRTGPKSTPPLARAIRASRCSTFWAPCVRASLQNRRSTVLNEAILRAGMADEASNGLDDRVAVRVAPVPARPSSPSNSASSRRSRISEASSRKRHSMSGMMARHYVRPNLRATIYPRRTDDFWQNRKLNAKVQARLTALFTGQLSIAEIEAMERRASQVLKKRSGIASVRLSKPFPPPTRPLPDVPTETDEHGSDKEDWERTPRAGAGKRTVSVQSFGDVSEGELRRLMNERRHPLRDSWVTETDSETSYCSWVSITDGSTCSSSSSRAARQGAQDGTRRADLRVPVDAHGGFSAPDAPPSSTILPIHHHITDGRASFAPPGWSQEAIPATQPAAMRGSSTGSGAKSTLPRLKRLSPFWIDAYTLWPKNARESQHFEDALKKWARLQQERSQKRGALEFSLLETIDDLPSSYSSRSVAHGGEDSGQTYSYTSESGSDSMTCSTCAYGPSDSCETCQTPRAASRARRPDSPPGQSSWTESQSSSNDSGLLTPPRSEYQNPLMESPGRRLSQCLTPRVPRQSHWSTSQAHLGPHDFFDGTEPDIVDQKTPCQTNRQSTASNYKPRHKRWILVDAEGKRITGGHHRESSSTWRSASYNAGEEGDRSSSSSSSTSSSAASSSWDSVDEETSSGQIVTNAQPRRLSVGGQAPVAARFASNEYPTAPPLRTTSPELVTPDGPRNGADVRASEHHDRHFSGASSTTAEENRPRSILRNAMRSVTVSEGTIRFSDRSGSVGSSALPGSGAGSVVSAAPTSSTVPSRSSSYSLSSTLTAGSAGGPPVGSNIRPRSDSDPSSLRLDKGTLQHRIKLERARNERNNERLETLGKLEGVSKPTGKVISSILKPPAMRRKDSGFLKKMTMAVPSLDALSGHGTHAFMNEKSAYDHAAAAALHPVKGEDRALPVTPLADTLDQLRDLEREWQRTHAASEMKSIQHAAHQFTNVTGFDIGLAPFKKVGGGGGGDKGWRESRTYPAEKAAGRTSVQTLQVPADPKLQRELQASLRKLSMTVEARRAAKQAYVDL